MGSKVGVKIHVKGFENEDKLSLKEEGRELVKVRKNLFDRLVEDERDRVLLMMVSKFERLRYEDLEEVYNDGCLVLWQKMMDEKFELVEETLVGLLRRICRNIGMHRLRDVNDDVESLDKIMENGFEGVSDEEGGLGEMFDVLDEKESDEEKYEKLESVWNNLKDVDKMILTSYYVEGCKLEEVAKRVGFKNSNSVKSKKDKVIKRMLKMMKEETE